MKVLIHQDDGGSDLKGSDGGRITTSVPPSAIERWRRNDFESQVAVMVRDAQAFARASLASPEAIELVPGALRLMGEDEAIARIAAHAQIGRYRVEDAGA